MINSFMINLVLYLPNSGRNKTKIGFVRTQKFFFNEKFNVFFQIQLRPVQLPRY